MNEDNDISIINNTNITNTNTNITKPKYFDNTLHTMNIENNNDNDSNNIDDNKSKLLAPVKRLLQTQSDLELNNAEKYIYI